MKKTVLRVISYLLVALLASVLTLSFSKRPGKLDRLEALIDRCFIEETNSTRLEDAAAAAMVAALDDRWSHYQSAEAYMNYKDAMSNSYVGVGITIAVREDGQGMDVQEVADNSPAQSAGVQAGDRLIAVDSRSIIGMTVTEVSSLIKGEEGTDVTLTLMRQEQELKLTVTRRRMQTVVATGQMLEENVGLITIRNFDDRCAQETIAAIEQLLDQGAEALIFDVRSNPGGYKREMVKVLDYLLPEGPLFKTVDYRGREEVDQSDAACLDIPMAVVVNLHSYSAAEFFAAALSEYDAAVIVGEKTYGKGYFQNTYDLKDGSAVTLSVGKYYTPQGNSLAGVGLTPDVEVPLTEQEATAFATGMLKLQNDPQILAALETLTGN